MSRSKAVAAVPDNVMAVLALAEEQAVREISGDRTRVKLENVGDWIVARLEAVREGVHIDSRIFDLAGPGSESLVLLGSAQLDRKVLPSLVGNVIGIFYVGDIETEVKGHSPMKNYRVFDFGSDWPDLPQTF